MTPLELILKYYYPDVPNIEVLEDYKNDEIIIVNKDTKLQERVSPKKLQSMLRGIRMFRNVSFS